MTLLLPKHAHIHDRPKWHIFVVLSKCDPSHNKWYKYCIYRNKYSDNCYMCTSREGPARFRSTHLISPPVLVFFCCSYFSFLCWILWIILRLFGHCIVYSFSKYGLWFPIWHLKISHTRFGYELNKVQISANVIRCVLRKRAGPSLLVHM
jgi:hypothetical protein